MDASDPLIPPPDLMLFGAIYSEVDIARAAHDYANMTAIVWPSTDRHGRLVVPPDEHVLDALARSFGLVGEEEAMERPAAGTVAFAPGGPQPCDFCQQPARYDGPVDPHAEGGPYCWRCEDCFLNAGAPSLGATGFTFVMLKQEVSNTVRSICEEITSRVGRESIFETS